MDLDLDLRSIIEIVGILCALAVLFVSRREIANFCRWLKPSDSVAVFGPKASGKTTLIRYLQGRQLPEQHISTFGAQPVGKIVFDLSGNETYFFRSREMYDVGGEHQGQWQVIIKKQNPNGIIYIVDTTQPSKESADLAHIAQVYCSIRTQEFANNIRLRSLLIFLNKCDIWGPSPADREKMMTHYRNEVLKDAINELTTEFGNLNIQFGAGSLTHTEHAQCTNDALRNFAMSLAKKE